jgi:acetyltransferase AlgX (SGNH hydrolase-like protein)
MRHTMRLLANTAIILISLTAALAAADGLSRLLYPPIREIHWYHHDPRYTMRHRANREGSTQVWGDGAEWHFRINARGFRGNDWAPTPSPGIDRVLVMGDSYTFGNAVDEEKTFPQLTDSLLRREGGAPQRWEVLNLGVVAWGPQNALAYLETEGADIGARCLIYAFFLGNDVVDNVLYHLYSLRAEELVRNPVSTLPDYNPKRLRAIAEALPLYDFLLQESQLFNLLRSTVLEHVSHEQEARSIYQNISPPDFEAALHLNDATLDRLRTVAHQRFGAFGLIIIPMLSEIVPDGASSPFPIHLADQSYDRVRAWARSRNAPVLDFYDFLRRNTTEAPKLYFAHDFHLNAAGDAVLAAQLAHELPRLCRPAAEAYGAKSVP